MAASMEHDENIADSETGAFYAILLVDKKASTAEINASYKRLSLQFHPDKHSTPEAKKTAEDFFNRIKRAKDVLTDPQLRSIYDAVGLAGLKEFENSRLVRKDMRSSKEIIEEYERLLEIKRFTDEINSYNPRAVTEVSLDLCGLFQSGYYDEDEVKEITIIEQLAQIEISKMRLSQGISLPIGDKDELSIDTNVQGDFDKGRNSGSITCQWQKRLSNKTFTSQVTIGSSPSLGVNLYWQLHKYWALKSNVSCHLMQGNVLFGLQTGLSVQLSKRLRVELSGTMGLGETITYNMMYSGENYSVSGAIQAGMSFFDVGHSPNRLMLRFHKTFTEHHLTLKCNSLISLNGAKLTLGCVKQFPAKQSNVATMLDLDTMKGVVLNVDITRGRQRFRIPLQLATELQPTATIYGLVLPIIAYAAVRAVLVLPYLKEQRLKALNKKKEQEKEALAQRRLHAQEEISLMSSAVEQNIANEEQKSGLIIVKALYGKLQLIQQNHSDLSDEVINVTVPLQNQVRNSALKIPVEMSKVNIPGFYDPCYGEEKKLYIRYKFRNKLHQVTLSDTDPIYIPKQGHLISSTVGS